MTFTKLLLTASLAIGAGSPRGSGPGADPADQGGLDPATIGKPLADSWPTYSGDYTGRRYSTLTQINQTTVKNLSLAWVGASADSGAAGGRRVGGFGGFGGGRGGGGGAPLIIGGEGPDDVGAGGGVTIKGAILQVDGVLYVSAPDHVWALDARDGHELWHYFWKTKGGTHIGSRGVGMWHNYLYVETPDNYLVSLDARTGKESWHVPIASFDEQYFSTMAPIVIGNHVLVGTGNDLDMPGFLQSFDPETGKLQWKFYTVPMKPGDPGLDTWPSLDAGAARRRAGLDSRRLRSGDEAVHLRHRQSDAGLHGCRTQGRQPVHLLAGRRQRRHRQDGVVLPDVAARHARLGLGADADPDRRDDRRPAAQARLHRRAQRLLLHASIASPASTSSRSKYGIDDELGEGHSRERIAGSESGKGSDDSRIAGVAGRRRRDELAAAGVLARTPACSTHRRTTASTSSI